MPHRCRTPYASGTTISPTGLKQELTLRQTALAWILGFVVLIWIVARGSRRISQIRGLPDDEAALPCLAVLLSSLEREGHSRQGNEPIERLAARVRDPRAAQLLERYAALRYGSIGDAGVLAQEIGAYAQATSARETA